MLALATNLKVLIFGKLLELLLRSICVHSQTIHRSTEQESTIGRFEGFGDSICIVLCLQEIERQSVRSYVHAYFSVAHTLHCCPEENQADFYERWYSLRGPLGSLYLTLFCLASKTPLPSQKISVQHTLKF